jgi:parvulin-like peptidyl-prolyl isomerase
VLEAPDGWHIIRALGTKPAAPKPFADVKDGLTRSLRQQAETQAAQDYVDKLLTEKNAAVNEIALRGVVEKPN